MRKAAKRDDNEKPIKKALLNVGAKVIAMDVPVDLLVYFRGTVFLLEVKHPTKGILTPDQFIIIKDGWPVHVVRNEMEALVAIGAATYVD